MRERERGGVRWEGGERLGAWDGRDRVGKRGLGERRMAKAT